MLIAICQRLKARKAIKQKVHLITTLKNDSDFTQIYTGGAKKSETGATGNEVADPVK